MHNAARWPALLAVMLAAALLLAFDWVVRQGMHQGVQRRGAEVAKADAEWRCATLPQQTARRDCRLAMR